jgi:hypothetical protein
MNPARIEIELTLTQLRRVGNNRANGEGPPDKTVQYGRYPFIVGELLDPALNKANSKAVLESLDCQYFQVRHYTVLNMGVGVFCLELHVPDAAQFDVRLRNNLRIGHTGNERPVVQTQVCQLSQLV